MHPNILFHECCTFPSFIVTNTALEFYCGSLENMQGLGKHDRNVFACCRQRDYLLLLLIYWFIYCARLCSFAS